MKTPALVRDFRQFKLKLRTNTGVFILKVPLFISLPSAPPHTVVRFIRRHDGLHQRVSHHIGGLENREGNATNSVQDITRVDESADLALLQVHLRDIYGDHRLGAKSDARQKHFHLLRRGVLRLVEDDERVVQSAPAHEGKRCHFNLAALEHTVHFVETQQIVECVDWTNRPRMRSSMLNNQRLPKVA